MNERIKKTKITELTAHEFDNLISWAIIKAGFGFIVLAIVLAIGIQLIGTLLAVSAATSRLEQSNTAPIDWPTQTP